MMRGSSSTKSFANGSKPKGTLVYTKESWWLRMFPLFMKSSFFVKTDSPTGLWSSLIYWLELVSESIMYDPLCSSSTNQVFAHCCVKRTKSWPISNPPPGLMMPWWGQLAPCMAVCSRSSAQACWVRAFARLRMCHGCNDDLMTAWVMPHNKPITFFTRNGSIEKDAPPVVYVSSYRSIYRWSI